MCVCVCVRVCVCAVLVRERERERERERNCACNTKLFQEDAAVIKSIAHNTPFCLPGCCLTITV